MNFLFRKFNQDEDKQGCPRTAIAGVIMYEIWLIRQT